MRATTRRSQPQDLAAIAGLSVAAHHRRLGFGATHPDIVGGGLDQAAQHGVAGQAEHIIHIVGLAPRHHFGAAIVAVATDRQPRGRPMAADATHQATQMTANFVSRGGLSGSQQNRHRTGGGGLIDVDRAGSERSS